MQSFCITNLISYRLTFFVLFDWIVIQNPQSCHAFFRIFWARHWYISCIVYHNFGNIGILFDFCLVVFFFDKMINILQIFLFFVCFFGIINLLVFLGIVLFFVLIDCNSLWIVYLLGVIVFRRGRILKSLFLDCRLLRFAFVLLFQRKSRIGLFEIHPEKDLRLLICHNLSFYIY